MRKDGLPYGRDHNGRLHQVRRHHIPDTDSIQETSLGPNLERIIASIHGVCATTDAPGVH